MCIHMYIHTYVQTYVHTYAHIYTHTYLFFRLQSFLQGKPKCKDADSIAAENFRMEIFRQDADPIAAEDIGMEIFCKVADSIAAEDFRVEINLSVCQLPSSSSLCQCQTQSSTIPPTLPSHCHSLKDPVSWLHKVTAATEECFSRDCGLIHELISPFLGRQSYDSFFASVSKTVSCKPISFANSSPPLLAMVLHQLVMNSLAASFWARALCLDGSP